MTTAKITNSIELLGEHARNLNHADASIGDLREIERLGYLVSREARGRIRQLEIARTLQRRKLPR